MIAVPAETPFTIPVPVPTVAIVVALLLHVPPTVAFDNAVVCPIQTTVLPVIGDNALAVTVLVAIQPPPSE